MVEQANLFNELPHIAPSKRLSAQVDGLFAAGANHFKSAPVNSLTVDFEGIEGDFHRGFTRQSGGREPWYQRGTKMRNERQLSIVARDELDAAAQEMGLDTIDPAWIGANISLGGVPMLSMLPASTLLFFEGGVTIKVDFQNGPCKIAGAAIAEAVGRKGDAELALAFPKVAKRRRGVVAWVEKPGIISLGEAVKVQLPEQWIYPV